MRALLLTAVLGVVLGASTMAHAEGVYVNESFGGSDVRGELADSFGSAFRLRIGGGYRYKAWAFEGFLAADIGMSRGEAPPSCDPERCFAARTIQPPPDGPPRQAYGLFTYGLDVKYLKTLSPNLELYLRGSVSRGVLDNDHAGNGLGVGAGLQLKGKVPAVGLLFWPLFFTNWGPKITASVYFDHGVDVYRLHGATDTIDGRLTHMTLGFAAGTDF